MAFYGDILRANFFDLKNSRNRQNNGDFFIYSLSKVLESISFGQITLWYI